MVNFTSPEAQPRLSKGINMLKCLLIASALALSTTAVNASPKDTATCQGGIEVNGQNTVLLTGPDPVTVVAHYNTFMGSNDVQNYLPEVPNDSFVGTFQIVNEDGSFKTITGLRYTDLANYMYTIITPTQGFTATASMSTYNIPNCSLVDQDGNPSEVKGVFARFKAYLAQIISMSSGVK